MGFQVELNWFIVAKKKEDITKVLGGLFLQKSGQRIYPVGKEFTLPIIVGGKCIGLGSVMHIEIEERGTRIVFQPVHVFEEDDPVAAYYEAQYADYKDRQEVIDDGGKVDLTPKFIERLRKGPEITH